MYCPAQIYIENMEIDLNNNINCLFLIMHNSICISLLCLIQSYVWNVWKTTFKKI